MNPTPRQLTIIRHIADVQERSGYCPTLAEIGDSLGITRVTVYEHIRALIERGLIHRAAAHKSRALSLTPEALAIVRPNRATCPHCGERLTAA